MSGMNRIVWLCLLCAAFGQEVKAPKATAYQFQIGKATCFSNELIQGKNTAIETLCCLPDLWCERQRSFRNTERVIWFETLFTDLPTVKRPIPLALRTAR